MKYAILIVFLLIFKFEITFNDLRTAFISNLPHTEKANYETQNGINIITNDDRCFDTPLPCTPYYEYYLKGKVIYRDSSNVRKGFRLVIDNYSSKL
ncbi:hypothetical protein [Raineya orbicola]|uniref:hypothetical protein n=1 Tax=Raineya orbicola TaxID=2016530 RepID=UPI000C6DF113|nr:hypothetical protein [Raineya orbicola]